MSLKVIRKLQVQILKRHIGPFLFCFLIVMFLLLMQFLILHVDKLIGKGIPAAVILELILTNLAYMVVLAVPMAVLVSCLMAFGKFSELNEFTSIRAAGINPLSIIRPILIAASLLTVFLIYFSNEVLPDANYKARSLFLDIRMQRPGFDLQENVFYDGIDGYNFLVRRIPAATDSLQDVTLFREGDDQTEAAIIKASRGYLTSVPDTDILSLFLFDGTVNRNLSESPDGKTRVERSHFNKYRVNFDLSDLSFSRTDPERRRRDDRTMSSQMMLAIIDSLHNDTARDFQRLAEGQGTNRALSLRRALRAGPDGHVEEIPMDTTELGASVNLMEAYADSLARMREQAGRKEAQIDTTDSVTEAITLNTEEIEETPDSLPTPFVVLNIIEDLEVRTNVAGSSVTTLRNTASRLSSLKNNMDWRAERTAQYMVEVHKKVSIPVGCIIFVLVGAPLGILTRKGNLGFNALISAVIFTYYWVTIIQGEKLADRMIISPFWGMWFGNITLLILGLYLTAKVMYEFRISDIWTRTELEQPPSGEPASDIQLYDESATSNQEVKS